MKTRLVALASAAAAWLAAGNAVAHDPNALHAIDVAATPGGVVVSTLVGPAFDDGTSHWTLLCRDALAAATESILRTGFLEDGTTVVVTERFVRWQLASSSGTCGAVVQRNLGGQAIAALVTKKSVAVLLGEPPLSATLATIAHDGTQTSHPLPSALAKATLFELQGRPCALGLHLGAPRIACLDGTGVIENDVGSTSTNLDVVAVEGDRIYLAARTKFDEPDSVLVATERGATIVASIKLSGIEKVQGTVVVGDRLLVAARAIAGADAARGALRSFDAATLDENDAPIVGPAFECLAAVGGRVYACVDRAIDRSSASVLSLDDAREFVPFFAFDQLAELNGCDRTDCRSTRLTLCSTAGLFCATDPEPAATDSTPHESAASGCAYGAGFGERWGLGIVLALFARRARR